MGLTFAFGNKKKYISKKIPCPTVFLDNKLLIVIRIPSLLRNWFDQGINHYLMVHDVHADSCHVTLGTKKNPNLQRRVVTEIFCSMENVTPILTFLAGLSTSYQSYPGTVMALAFRPSV